MNKNNQKEIFPPININTHRIGKVKYRHIGMIYFRYSEYDAIAPFHASEANNDWKWVTEADFDNNIETAVPIKAYVKKALE